MATRASPSARSREVSPTAWNDTAFVNAEGVLKAFRRRVLEVGLAAICVLFLVLPGGASHSHTTGSQEAAGQTHSAACSLSEFALRGGAIAIIIKVLMALKGKDGAHSHLPVAFLLALVCVSGMYFLQQCSAPHFRTVLLWTTGVAICSRLLC